jgi:hypothetical protein
VPCARSLASPADFSTPEVLGNGGNLRLVDIKPQLGMLQVEQLPLAVETTAVADEVARRADDAVAGQDDGNRIAIHDRAYRTRRSRPTRTSGQLPVRRHLTERHLREPLEDDAREVGAAAQVDGQVEALPSALEVLVEFTPDVVERESVTS